MPSPQEARSNNAPSGSHDRRKLDNDERRAIYEALINLSVRGDLPHGAYRKVGRMYNCYWKTAARIWQRGVASLRGGSAVAIVDSKLKGNFNRKRTAEEIE
ncbi:hypothetical protein H257_13173 [Aphanomyces astaci]|uniref:DUF7769 domain-containing protein n=1 Tax=Aphanomyces astaci TaxID=112090 RepID=W4FVH1_APHAT|nr:hypothetical protein H257_13173 [Aphanomyces astaci]ETV71510.1 hypothetical protein H257_13173 [Aphanomyces astaci]|eukprot:XP_009838943.1 hypothetical protein H257_13173 [Aphanomyces astaci]